MCRSWKNIYDPTGNTLLCDWRSKQTEYYLIQRRYFLKKFYKFWSDRSRISWKSWKIDCHDNFPPPIKVNRYEFHITKTNNNNKRSHKTQESTYMKTLNKTKESARLKNQHIWRLWTKQKKPRDSITEKTPSKKRVRIEYRHMAIGRGRFRDPVHLFLIVVSELSPLRRWSVLKTE